MPKLKYIRNVVTLQLDQQRCIGCGMCVNVCPHAVFEMVGKKSPNRQPRWLHGVRRVRQNCPTTAILVHAGVGCVMAIIKGAIRGTEPTCECSGSTSAAC